MDGDRKPCLMRPASGHSAATQLYSQHTRYPSASLKQENLDSNVLEASAQTEPLPSFANQLVPRQVENCRSASSLEYSPCLEVYNAGVNHTEGNYDEQGVVAVSDPVEDHPLDALPRPIDSSRQVENCRSASSLDYSPCLEVYNAGVNYTEGNYDEQGVVAVSDPVDDQVSPLDALPRPIDSSRRVLPAVGAFTVQCARCFKWRLIPTKEQYEAIRQCILEHPWVCENACIWRPNASCNDPADLSQDRSRLWAIDKPNISRPPPGWERLLVIRGEGASKFADVYYVTPSGKKLRSMVEVERFLIENPEYILAGVNLSQFSYQIPKPLYEGYVRKRPPSSILQRDMQKTKTISETEKSLNATEVNPLSWRKAVGSSNLGIDSSKFGTAYFTGASCDPRMQSAESLPYDED